MQILSKLDMPARFAPHAGGDQGMAMSTILKGKPMTKTAKNSDEDQARQKTIADFKEAVNMTPAQLEKWLASEDAKRVGQKDGNGESVGHQSGRRIIALLHRPASELDEDDLAHMRKVVGYVHRHLAQGPSKSDPATSDWRYSLMNWGHDPERK